MRTIHLFAGATLTLLACSDRPEAVSPTDASPTRDARSTLDMSARDLAHEMLDGNMSLRDLAVEMLDSEAPRTDVNVGSGHGDSVHPRWVLRDSTGAAVLAHAFPVFPQAAPQTLQLPPVVAAPECFSVSMRGSDRWFGTYSLATGTMDACASELPTSYFVDDACTQPVLVGSATAPAIAMFSDGLYFARDRLAVGTPVFLGTAQGDCIPSGMAGEGSNWYTPAPVPSAYASAFAEGAPYTITFEY